MELILLSAIGAVVLLVAEGYEFVGGARNPGISRRVTQSEPTTAFLKRTVQTLSVPPGDTPE
jgi:hypothetical protein